jgi:catechol 2,3-dioxygenase-like lactoylglutathione lyase family enzyme
MQIDHVTVGATDLEAGARFIRSKLNADIPNGGKHPHMSTHNKVARVGNGVFLEIIAIDSGAAAPPRPRWFGLDHPGQAARLARSSGPIGWVVRTTDIAAVQACSPVDLGPASCMSRGELSWKLTIPDSGMQPFAGLVPAFIEWDGEPHPSVNMAFPGPQLKSVILRHPQPKEIEGVLNALGIGHLAQIEQSTDTPSLAFAFELPDGKLVMVE